MPWYWPFSKKTKTLSSVSNIDKLQYVIDAMQYTLEHSHIEAGIFRISGHQSNVTTHLKALDHAKIKSGLSFFPKNSAGLHEYPSIPVLSSILKQLLDRLILEESTQKTSGKDAAEIQKLLIKFFENSTRLADYTESFSVHMNRILDRTPALRSLFNLFLFIEKNEKIRMDPQNIAIVFAPKFINLFSGTKPPENYTNESLSEERKKDIYFSKMLEWFLIKDLKENAKPLQEEVRQKPAKAVRFLDEKPPELPERTSMLINLNHLTKNLDGSLCNEQTFYENLILNINSANTNNQSIILDLTGYTGSLSELFSSIQFAITNKKLSNTLNFKIIATDHKFVEKRYNALFDFLEKSDSKKLQIFETANGKEHELSFLYKKYFQGAISIDRPENPRPPLRTALN